MQHSVVASRYAQAFFDLAQEQGSDELHKANSVLSSFKDAVNLSENLSLFIKDPVLTIDEKKSVLKSLLEKFNASPLVNNFFFLLLEKKRLVFISDISEQFSALVDNADGISRGTLTTAVNVSEAHQSEIVQKLEKQTGRKLALNFVVDPSLLGGTVLKIGDIILDSSLATQLNNLSQTIKKGGGE